MTFNNGKTKLSLKELDSDSKKTKTVTNGLDQIILNNHKDFPINEYEEIENSTSKRSSNSSFDHKVHSDLKPKLHIGSQVKKA